MAGLTNEGFTPKSLAEIQNSIKSKLEVLSPGFDFSPESPDGQLIEIMSLELSQAWNELGFIHTSYDPNRASGAALRNLGLITGIPYGSATRSQAMVNLTGTAGTLVPQGSIVEDASGNKFATSFNAYIPSAVQVVAITSGAIAVPIGTITTVGTSITGWTGVTQTLEGTMGSTAQTEQAFRVLRNRTVLRNYSGVTDTIQARLVELGLEQVSVVENDAPSGVLPDGTPANQIHVTIATEGTVTDEDVARVILQTKPAGITTYGTTTVAIDDQQGNSHDIKFTKATAVPIFMNIEVTWLSDEFAGAEEAAKAALTNYVNNLQVGEDVIFSRLYGLITPYGKAQVNTLEIGTTALGVAASNVSIGATQFATSSDTDIVFAVV